MANKAKQITLAQLVTNVTNGADSKFFLPENMRFFGDTMGNYAVGDETVMITNYRGEKFECYELKRINPVGNRLMSFRCQDSAYFCVKTFKRVLPSQDYPNP